MHLKLLKVNVYLCLYFLLQCFQENQEKKKSLFYLDLLRAKQSFSHLDSMQCSTVYY